MFGDAAEKVDQDDARSRAVYLMDTRQRSEAKKALMSTLEDRLHEDGHIDVRSTRFSLEARATPRGGRGQNGSRSIGRSVGKRLV